ncbi:MAG: hypothetical protein KJO07_05325 [Deltaproteobacteria bacterium]|nr:hypothetical protein [Deltaproteobacteria bacterium]
MTRFTHPLIATFAALALTASIGCQAQDSDADLIGDDESSVASALEQDNGGYTMDDEPELVSDELLAAADLDEVEDVEEEALDPTVTDETDEMMNRPDAVLIHGALVWGQFPFNPEFQEPKNWSGRLSVNRGAIVVRQTIAFEPATDRLLPRRSRLFVDFTSVTGPHHDGLRLTIIDPTPEVDQPLEITYSTPDGEVLRMDVRDLVGEPQRLLTDDLGNHLVGGAVAQAIDNCANGFLAGRWHRIGPRGGVLLGRVRGPMGGLRGFMRGLYGQNAEGEKIFFGKYVGLAGQFRGIYAGTYGDGEFRGRWIVRTGDKGVLGGHYRESAPGPRIGGHFIGRWAETTCQQ